MIARVRFVDDEPRILEGFQRLLRKHREAWSTQVALGGAVALDMLRAKPFDFVLTTCECPGWMAPSCSAGFETCAPPPPASCCPARRNPMWRSGP